MFDQALEGVKILDLTHYIAGPYCTKLFADYGADVIKVERSGGGDPARHLGPFLNDDPHGEKSGPFFHLNTNKRSITLNLKVASGKAILKQLVKEADLLVENFSPRVMPSLGVDYSTLSQINPKLTMTSISNFGQTGPYRDYKASELVLYGIGGEMISIGVEGREPLKQAGNAVQYEAGATAASATLAALFAAERDGLGQHIDVSIIETQMAGVDRKHSVLISYQFTGEFSSQHSGWGVGFASGTFPCKDGYIEFLGDEGYFPRAIKLLGEPEFLKDPKWADPEAALDPELREEFVPFFMSWLMSHTKREIFEMGQKARVLCGALYDTSELLTDPHFRAREFWMEMEHPITGPITYTGAPVRMSETPRQMRRPAPLLGEHNEEVYGHLGYSKEDLVRLRERQVI